MASTSQNGLQRRHFAAPASSSDHLALTVSQDSTELTAAQANTEQHAKRLTTYTKTALLVTGGLFGSFYTNFNMQENKTFIRASYITLLFSFILEVLLLWLIDCIKNPNYRDTLPSRYEETMYIFIYASNSLLMLTAMFLLLLCTLKYAYLAVFLGLALLVNSTLLYHGNSKHTASAKEYKEHDNELNHFSELSSGIVIMLFAGLSSFVFANPTLSLRKNQIKVAECFLFIIIIMSLILMLLTTVPPKAELSTRKSMVEVVKNLFYALVTLLTMVGLIAASEILEGLVVLSTLPHIIGATIWFIAQLLYKPDNPGEKRELGEVDSLTMVFAAISFFALMFVYFQNVDSIEHYSWSSYLLMAICMTSLCSTFMGFLNNIIFIYAPKTRARAISSFVTNISLIVACVSTIMNALYGSHTSKGSSTST